jgi:hypothetical protein
MITLAVYLISQLRFLVISLVLRAYKYAYYVQCLLKAEVLHC